MFENEEQSLFQKAKNNPSEYTKKIASILNKLEENNDINVNSGKDNIDKMLRNPEKIKLKTVFCKKMLKLNYCDYKEIFKKECPHAHSLEELEVTYHPNYYINIFKTNKKNKIINKKGQNLMIESVLNNDKTAFQKAIQAGDSPEFKDFNGMDAISYCIKNNNYHFLLLIINNSKHKINFNSYIDKLKGNYLIYSVKLNNLRITNLLINEGSDINFVDKSKQSAIFYAIDNSNTELANLLMKNNANMSITNNEGLSAIDYCIKYNCEMLGLFLKYNININVNSIKILNIMFKSAKKNDINTLELLILKGVPAYSLNKKKNNLLIISYLYHNYYLFELLLEKHGFSAWINYRNIYNYDILYYITIQNDIKNMLLLKKYSNTIDYQGKYENGLNLMILAIKYESLDIIDFLYNEDFNINSYDNDLNSNFIYACKSNNILIMKKILKFKNININWKNNDKRDGKYYVKNKNILQLIGNYDNIN